MQLYLGWLIITGYSIGEVRMKNEMRKAKVPSSPLFRRWKTLIKKKE